MLKKSYISVPLNLDGKLDGITKNQKSVISNNHTKQQLFGHLSPILQTNQEEGMQGTAGEVNTNS